MLLLPTLFALNLLWFGAGFWFFSVVPRRATRLLVPRSQRDAPLFRTLVASVRFLGGMNLALSAFAALLVLEADLFPDPRQNALFLGVFALAHGTQLFFNISVLAGGRRQGEALWPVTSGPMLFIFVVDGTLAAANLLLAATLLFR